MVQHNSHNNFPNLNNTAFIQGILFLIGGVLLLLYSLNALNFGITVLLIFASVALILYGAMISGLAHTVRHWIERLRRK